MNKTIALLRGIGVAHWTNADTWTLKKIAEEIDREENQHLRALLCALWEEKRRVDAVLRHETMPVDIG